MAVLERKPTCNPLWRVVGVLSLYGFVVLLVNVCWYKYQCPRDVIKVCVKSSGLGQGQVRNKVVRCILASGVFEPTTRGKAPVASWK